MNKSIQESRQYIEILSEVKSKIITSQTKALKAVNKELVLLYCEIGKLIVERQIEEGWGKSLVELLAAELQKEFPNLRGFSARNMWRMKQFYETYKDYPKLSALLTEISWTNHLHILSKTKTLEEKEFYITLSAKNHYSEREFARIIDSSTYERTAIANQKLSGVLSEFKVDAKGVFKDSYIFEFLGLSEPYQEKDLRKALILHLKKFLLELGPDLSLMGEEYPLQVGMKDFRIDILM